MSDAPRRILVVEDQRLIAADLETTLSKLGYVVAGSVASGEEAVAHATDLRPDLVLMDIRLRGEMDGIEAADTIHKRMDVPIVFLTAYADEETIARAKVATPFGYVVKPFNERELRAAIEIALYRHATERLLAQERARRQAAEEFKLFVDGVEDYAIYLLDASGRVASWNEGASRIKGYDVDEILGQHFSCFYRRKDADAGVPQRTLETARSAGRAEVEGWCVRKDGSRFWAHGVITALYDDQGELRGFGKITRDITDIRQNERQLREAVHMRDEFLQIASHELKTPLTPLQLQLDMLARIVAQVGMHEAGFASSLETARRQTERLGRLVESLLDVTRISSGHMVLERDGFDLAQLARELVERFGTEADRAGSQLHVEAPAPVAGHWDRLRIEQILANLISNAIKYGSGNPVEVRVYVRDDMACVEVADNGIGIDDDALERVFGRFERATSMRHFGGLGLGLYIARQIALAHGGDIHVTSEPGVGSTFTLELHRQPPQHGDTEPDDGVTP